jgi:type I restriction enzyme S subunit
MAEALKPGWRRWRFDQMATNVNVRVDDPSEAGVEYYVGLEHLDSDSLKIRRWGSPEDVSATKLLFKPGDIIFGRRRAYQRKLGVAEWRGIASAHSLVLRAKTAVVLPDFLPFFMQSDLFMTRAQEISVGSLSPTINWKALAKQEFALPPLEEQQRVCKLLKLLDDTLERNRSALDELKRVQISTLIQWQQDWEKQHGIRKVGDLLREKPRNGLSPPIVEDATPLKTVSISSVREGRFSPDGCRKFAEISNERAASFIVQKGDVFVVRGNGNRLFTGQAGFAAEDYSDTFYPDLLIRLRFDPNVLDAKLATAIWNSPRTHSRLIARAKSTNGIWKVNGQDIRSHHLSVPPPQLQREYLAVLESFSRSREACTQRLHALENQKRIVLRRLDGSSQ